jgi:hypothetical protein
VIIPARPCHVCQMLVEGVRDDDRLEIQAASGLDAGAALFASLTRSTKAWVLLDSSTRRACGMWGVGAWRGDSRLGIPWLIATPTFNLGRNRRELLRHTPEYVRQMGEGFDYLINYTDVRNTASHRWLKWAGFQFDDFAPQFGVERRPFFRFSKETYHV